MAPEIALIFASVGLAVGRKSAARRERTAAFRTPEIALDEGSVRLVFVELGGFAFSTILTLLVVIDPPAVIPVFLAMTNGQSNPDRRRAARRAAWAAFFVLATFAVVGSFVFRMLGISMGAFRIAGGVLLLLLSIDMLRAQPSRQRTTPEEEEEGTEKDDVSIFPLAIPMLAGPGATSTVMVLVARAATFWEYTVVAFAIALTCFACFVSLSAAAFLAEKLGKTGLNVLQRVMGLLLSATAVQFILEGLRISLLSWHQQAPSF